MKRKSGFIDGLEQRPYVTHELHRFLPDDAWQPAGPNIGKRGENLTIALLSLERPSLSLRLVQSMVKCIPDFAGEILIVDNGSSVESQDSLRRGLAQVPSRCRVVTLGSNHGVGGGRNRGMEHAVTDWVMWLDNDIYFIGNPLPDIQKDIAQLGCHFLNIPLLQPDCKTLFAMGGHLYLEARSGELYIGGGTSIDPTVPDVDASGFLCTFLFGGASVCQRHSFQRIGGYDEHALVGFEDIDFSLRLFRAGLKVGSTGATVLVHDHPPPQTRRDIEYDNRRFASNVLQSSAKYFEAKHGFRFWSETTSLWIETRRAALEIGDEEQRQQPSPNSKRDKPRIALVIDVEYWAFFNISSQIIRLLSDRFDFTVISMDSLEESIVELFLMCEDRDLIHFFWRDDLSLLKKGRSRSQAAESGFSYGSFLRRYVESKAITTSIFDHLLLEPKERAERRWLFNDRLTAYAVSSERLKKAYCGIAEYPRPAAVLQDGVDLRLFRPMRLERFDDHRRPLVVGWVGNSRWADEIVDFKGLRTILKPVLEELVAEEKSVQWIFADSHERFVPFNEMPNYYASIDVLVCCSKIEGTPNPVLEAMACGVPVISTDVGIVPEVFGELQRQLIVAEPTRAGIKAALDRVIADRKFLRLLSQENLSVIHSWDWSTRALKYGEFFDQALARHRAKVI